jgi:ABC-2 type transport system permease protein
LSEWLRLTHNETTKIVQKRRFLVIFLILLVLIPIFVYAQMKQAQTLRERLGTEDWKVVLQQQIVDTQNRLASSRIPEEWQQWLKIRVEQQQYYLDHNVNPLAPGAPTFTKEFLGNSITLFLPLLVMVIATDMVSGEHGDGTIKLLLTRPVKRWKILLSKLTALTLFVSLTVGLLIMLSYLLSGVVFGYGGWTSPVLTGFKIDAGNLDTSNVHLVPMWEYLMMSGGFAWFVSWVVGIISLMVSVLVRSTAAGMGIMLSAIIAGTVLSAMASSWEGAKYLFIVNLELTQYLSGELPPIEGMTLGFSLAVLGLTAFSALVVSFVTFVRQDMLA